MLPEFAPFVHPWSEVFHVHPKILHLLFAILMLNMAWQHGSWQWGSCKYLLLAFLAVLVSTESIDRDHLLGPTLEIRVCLINVAVDPLKLIPNELFERIKIVNRRTISTTMTR